MLGVARGSRNSFPFQQRTTRTSQKDNPRLACQKSANFGHGHESLNRSVQLVPSQPPVFCNISLHARSMKPAMKTHGHMFTFLRSREPPAEVKTHGTN